MAEYADYDFAQMRSDAVRRVEEMQKRSHSYVARENAAQHPARGGQETAKDSQKKKDVPPKPEPHVPQKQDTVDPASTAPESDTFILLLLILILSKEGADQSLIFALLYMLL